MNTDPSRFFVDKHHIRVNSPAGGRGVSEIFNPGDQGSPARKVRETQKSSIINTGVGVDSNANPTRSSLSPRHTECTKNRLFGANGELNGTDSSPRRNNDTWRSNISFNDDGQRTPDGMKRTPKKRFPSGGMNPITGTPLHGQSNGGTPTRTNGMTNGMHTYDQDDVLTVVLGNEGNGPVAMLNGHGNVRANGDHNSH